MKHLYKNIFCIIVLFFATKATIAQCDKPFISEIVFSQDSTSLSGNSNIPNSYAVELFNPKNTFIDLEGYYIKLIDVRQEATIINLSGQIDAYGKFVVAFSLSDNTLLNISQMVTSLLNYNEKISLEFGNNVELLDKVGSTTITTADSINIAAALADPINYLNSINLNFSSLENFIFRRKSNITSGNPNFTNVAQNWNVAPNGDISNVGQFDNICSPTITSELFYKIDNQMERTYPNGDKFFEYDVSVKANDTITFLQTSHIFVQYPLSIFGLNLFQFMVLQTLDNFAQYSLSHYTIPADSIVVHQAVINNPTVNPRVRINTEFQKFYRVKWKINNLCNDTINFSFSPSIITANTNFTYSPNVSFGTQNQYAALHLQQNIEAILCKTYITDFEPKTLRAGVRDTLLIKGYNFLPTSSQISFKNSINGGATYTDPCNNNDYILKNDSLIKLIVPSIIKDFSIDTLFYYPGSGKIKLYDGLNSIYSQDELKIKYAITNDMVSNTTSKYMEVLQKTDTTAYVFHLDSASVNSVSGARAAIEKAIEQWRCHTHVNFRLGEDVSNTTFSDNDGINTIFFVDANNNSILHSRMISNFNSGKTGRSRISCSNFKSYLQEADIAFVKNPSLIDPILQGWNTECWVGTTNPQNKLDFYQNILHELGHVHTLDHVIDSLELMHYSTNPYIETSYLNRVDLTNSPFALEAGNYSVQLATEPTEPLQNCNNLPMVEQNVSICTTKLDEINNEINLVVFPNPTKNYVTIQFNDNPVTKYNLSIYNQIAGLVYSKDYNQNNIQIRMHDFANGLYYFRINYNGQNKIVKIIKQ